MKKKDFKFSNLFKVQDQLSNEILNELQINFGVGAGMRGWSENYRIIEEFTQFLNWRDEWRKFTKTSNLKSKEMLSDMKKTLAPENAAFHMMDSWQLMQKVILKLSTDKETDLKKIDRLCKINRSGSKVSCCVDDIDNLNDINNIASDNNVKIEIFIELECGCLLYTSPSPRDRQKARKPSSG